MRNWYEPWFLFGEMIFLTVVAIGLLLIDVAMRFTDPENAMSKAGILYDFKERMYLVYTTIPFYLRELRHNIKI